MRATILSQITWEHMFALYLGTCVVSFLCLVSIFIFEDIRMYREPWRKATSKFGYNFKSKVTFVMLAALCVPILNLLTLTFFVWSIAFAWLESYTNRIREQENANSV